MDRRRFLEAGAAFLISCGGSQNPDGAPVPLPALVVNWTDKPRIPEVRQWLAVEVSSANLDVIELQNVQVSQVPFIGIKELYLVTNSKDPLIAVVMNWDSRFTVTPSDSNIKTVAFQAVEENFMPDINRTESFGGLNINRQLALQFVDRAVGLTEEIRRKSLKKGESLKAEGKVLVLPRPSDNRPYTLVFKEGLAGYNGQRSPQSFLAAKFSFR